MASSLQRWAFLLCTCLVLHEFAPVYTAHISHHALRKQSESDDEDGSKRGLIFAGLKYFVGGGLKAVSFGANLYTFALTVDGMKNNCNNQEKGIVDIFAEIKTMTDQYDEISKDIRATSWKACKTQTRAQAAFDSYKFTRELFKYLDDEHKLVLETISAEARLVLNAFDHNITLYLEKFNASGEAVDAAKVEEKYGSDLENGLTLAYTGFQMAVPVFKTIWKKYLKNTYVGKKISEIGKRLKVRFFGKTKKAQAALKRITSSGFLGRATNFIKTKLQGISNRATSRFGKAFRKLDKVKGALKLVGPALDTALSVWFAIEKSKECRGKLDKAKQSKTAMAQELENIKQIQKDMNDGYEQVKEAWLDIWNTTTEGDLLELLKKTKEMVLDEYFLKAEDEKQELAQKIDRYLEVAEMDPTDESSEIALNTAQEALNERLSLVKVTFGCFRKKGSLFNVVRDSCARGDNPFLWIYDNAKSTDNKDEDKCAYRTGEQYISVEKMREGWDAWVERNGTKFSTCMMNNKMHVDDIKKEMYGNQDPKAEEIVKTFLSSDKWQQGIPEVEEIIKKVQRENPDIANQLKEQEVSMVCNALKNNSVKETQNLLNMILGKNFTIDQIKEAAKKCDT